MNIKNAKIFIGTLLSLIVIIGIVLIVMVMGSGNHALDRNPAGQKSGAAVIRVVAAENFWASLVSQLGGSHVSVIGIVSDPNADPHEYESNTSDARAFAQAQYIILNGVGYDSWADKLISAESSSSQRVLDVGNLVGKKEGDNPHLWYDPAYVDEAVSQMENDLISIDPSDAPYYQAQYKTLMASLAVYQSRIQTIKRQFGGTKVAATEDIFQYLSDAAGLDLISPSAFTEAVAEGNDPPAASLVEFEKQLTSGQVQVLVYNQQTVTPLTESIKKLAADQGIPIIGVTETIQPPDVPFQDWMNSELIALQNALNAKTLGQ